MSILQAIKIFFFFPLLLQCASKNNYNSIFDITPESIINHKPFTEFTGQELNIARNEVPYEDYDTLLSTEKIRLQQWTEQFSTKMFSLGAKIFNSETIYFRNMQSIKNYIKEIYFIDTRNKKIFDDNVKKQLFRTAKRLELCTPYNTPNYTLEPNDALIVYFLKVLASAHKTEMNESSLTSVLGKIVFYQTISEPKIYSAKLEETNTQPEIVIPPIVSIDQKTTNSPAQKTNNQPQPRNSTTITNTTNGNQITSNPIKPQNSRYSFKSIVKMGLLVVLGCSMLWLYFNNSCKLQELLKKHLNYFKSF